MCRKGVKQPTKTPLTKINMKKLALALFAITAMAFLPSIHAQVFTEIGDAGQTVQTGQNTGLVNGNPLNTILGTLGAPDDVDLYRIQINTPSAFSATTVNALTAASGLDTQLYLFSLAGNGKAINANDDDSGGLTLQSTLGPNLPNIVNPGVYYLAIATSGNEAVDAVNQLLFSPDSPSTVTRTPNGSAGALASWDTTFADPGTGAYEIDLTGAFTSVPEPGTWFAAALALLGVFFFRSRRSSKQVATCAIALLATALVIPAFAIDVPQNCGNGLDELVRSNNMILSGVQGIYNGYATEKAAGYAQLAIQDQDTGKFLVDIHLDGSANANDMVAKISDLCPSFEVTAIDTKYHNVGMIEGFISVSDVTALATKQGVTSVQLGLKPYHKTRVAVEDAVAKATTATTAKPTKPTKPGKTGTQTSAIPVVGTYSDYGVSQHRVDQISQIFNPAAPTNWDGSGMQIGAISDSFNGNTGAPTAATNVTNNDLPGSGSNPYGNNTPVANLQDFPGGTDEGRAICQILYHMAPRAKLAFATADIGELSFANNIRALAGLPGFTFPGQTFAADTICDDVGYFDEPFFADGVISQAIDDSSAAGVAYFSSAANDVDVNGYSSPLRVVANGTGLTSATNAALVNTNINLASVPTGLYQGGFHNFDPSGNPAKQKVSQTVNIGANNTNPTTLEWDDPYDFNAGAVLGTQIYSNTGSYTATSTANPLVQFDNTSTPPLPPLTANQGYVLTENATSGNYDAQVSIINPDNTTLVNLQDTGVDETVRFVAPQTGNYKFQFGHFANTTGNFSFVLNNATFTQYVVSNWNLLAFRVDTGAYVPNSSLTANTLSTNQPIQLGFTNETSSTIKAIQYVFARSNTPPANQRSATQIRYLIPANGAGGYGPAEFFTYGSPTTGGHATAATCNGMAAYSVFRPSIPEGFTSPGPAMIFFDRNNNLIPGAPQIRLKPNLAAADAANSQWNEAGDSTADGDTVGNFSGTSAAGPHAASVGAMVLQAHGGPRSLTPAQLTTILQNTTFPHDLDPYTATASIKTGNGGKVTISIISDNSANAGAVSGNVATTVGTGTNDPNAISVAYVGPGFVKSVAFNPNGLASQGGAVTDGNNGLDSTNTYFTNTYPGLAFLPATKAFTVGNLSQGLTSADVTAAFTNLCPLPSNLTSQWWTMTLNFPNNNFSGGKSIRFTVGRGNQHSAAVGTYATPTGGVPFAGPNSGTTSSNPIGDLWGGGVQIPEGTVTTAGMTVTVTMSDNSTATGTIQNRIGAGWTNLDGFGFINAQAAANAPAP